MHATLIATHIIRQQIESDENDIPRQLLRVLEIFTYLGTILYQQFFILYYPPVPCEDFYVFLSKSWMMMELFVFYSLFVNAVVFIAYISCRGMCGRKKIHENRNRFKFDALDYYETDIEWCSFQSVPVGLCITGLLITSKIGRNIEEKDKYILGLIIFERFVQFLLMSPFRTQDGALVVFKPWKWLLLGSIQICAIMLFQQQS